MGFFVCLFLCVYFIFPDKVRVRDAGEKLPHSLKATEILSVNWFSSLSTFQPSFRGNSFHVNCKR